MKYTVKSPSQDRTCFTGCLDKKKLIVVSLFIPRVSVAFAIEIVIGNLPIVKVAGTRGGDST